MSAVYPIVAECVCSCLFEDSGVAACLLFFPMVAEYLWLFFFEDSRVAACLVMVAECF